jgi:DNA-binding Lrp family transcriptional regulator
MKPAQRQALSENLNSAIRPSRTQKDATVRVLDQFDPLPILRRSTPSDGVKPESSQAGVNLTPVSVNTVSNLTPVSNSEGSREARRSGYLKVPNEILDQVLPSLESSEAVVFLRLYRLSIGFNQPTCTVGMTGLMRACNLSESTCRRALRRLIELGYLRQFGVVNTREVKGSTYQIETGVNLIPVSKPDRCQFDTGVTVTPNKDDDDIDDLIHNNHHHSETPTDDDSPHLQEVSRSYSAITGNPWLPADTQAYTDNRIATVAICKVVEIMQGVKQRSGSRINSFNYFVKEILSGSDPRNRQSQRRSLARIVQRVRESHVGAHNYGIADFVFDVKQTCAREGVLFDNDLFNSLNA